MNLQQKNRRILGILVGLSITMVALSFASVPLYRLFCQITGFGGTVRQSQIPHLVTSDRVMRIRFTANVDKDMPWQFKPNQQIDSVRVGERHLAAYEAYNPTSYPITGTAVFNVTPHKAGPYFSKIECFCFTDQTLLPGERKTLPVNFFVDPEIAHDKNLDDVKEIVLSYTFYLSSHTPQITVTEHPARENHSNGVF